jgi:CheY-like chemotaxis protein
MHAILVDDNDHFRTVTAALLERAGHTVHMTSNVRDALRYLRESPTDVIITDILMPGQDGLELIMKVRQAHPNIPVIAVTGDCVRSDLYLGMATKLGAAATLLKPFSVDELLIVLAGIELARCSEGPPDRKPPKTTP